MTALNFDNTDYPAITEDEITKNNGVGEYITTTTGLVLIAQINPTTLKLQ